MHSGRCESSDYWLTLVKSESCSHLFVVVYLFLEYLLWIKICYTTAKKIKLFLEPSLRNFLYMLSEGITKAELSSDGDWGSGNLIFALWLFTHRLFPAPRLEEGRDISEFWNLPPVDHSFLPYPHTYIFIQSFNIFFTEFYPIPNKMFRVSPLNNSHPTAALFIPDTSAGDLLDVEKLAKGTFILSTPDLIQFFTLVLYFLLFSSMLCAPCYF